MAFYAFSFAEKLSAKSFICHCANPQCQRCWALMLCDGIVTLTWTEGPCELLPSLGVRRPSSVVVVVVVVNILKKSSPLKLPDRFQPNFIQLFLRVLATILSFKIFNLSKNMAAVTKNRTGGSDSSFSQITRKQKQVSKFWEILGRSARQDLSAVRFSWWSFNRCRSYCPF